MPRRAPLAEPNIRATATATLFYADVFGPLLDWLVRDKGMEKDPPAEIGRHYAVLRAPRMELVVDAAAMTNGFQLRCLGGAKEELADWITEYSRKWENDEL